MTEYQTEVEVDSIDASYDYSEWRVFDSNGSKVLVGLDQYGFVSVEKGEVRSFDHDDGDVFYAFDDPHKATSFAPPTAEDVAQFISELV